MFGFCIWFLFCDVVFSVLFSLAIILKHFAKEERVIYFTLIWFISLCS